MANISDTIKQGIANTGGRILTTISNVNPTVGGKVAKVTDQVGQFLKNPLPQAQAYGEGGATAAAESAGGYAQAAKATTPEEKAKVEAAAQQRAGFASAAAQDMPGQKEVIGQYNVDPNNLDALINVNGTMKTGRTILAETGGTGTYTSGGDNGGDKMTGDDVRNIARDSGASDFLTDKDLQDLMTRYGDKSRGSAGDLAAEIERVATENSDREYNTVKQALGVQREEVGRVGETQRGRVAKEKEMGLSELTDKEETETKKIEKEKEGFLGEVADTTETLARNWRDMSLNVQRIARARGTQDSSFSAAQEGDVMMDFNRGLRTLSKQSVSAVADFGEAVIETNKFYTREKANLEEQARQQMEDIDTWTRQEVQKLQAQENQSLTKKLNDIRSAISQGNQLKIQTEQSINEKQFALDSWMLQTQVQYKNAVSLAAQGKSQNAADTIAKYRDLAKESYDLVTKGGYQPEVVKDANGNTQYVIHGKLPNGEDDYIQMTVGGFDTLTQNVYGNLGGGDKDPVTGLPVARPYDATKLNEARGAAGLTPVGASTPQSEESGGLLSTLKGMFN